MYTILINHLQCRKDLPCRQRAPFNLPFPSPRTKNWSTGKLSYLSNKSAPKSLYLHNLSRMLPLELQAYTCKCRVNPFFNI